MQLTNLITPKVRPAGQSACGIGSSLSIVKSRAFLADIVHAYKGSVVESYVDGTTFSTSIAAPDFHHSVQSGKHKVNVQIALHQDTITGLWRLTLGTSVITMEY